MSRWEKVKKKKKIIQIFTRVCIYAFALYSTISASEIRFSRVLLAVLAIANPNRTGLIGHRRRRRGAFVRREDERARRRIVITSNEIAETRRRATSHGARARRYANCRQLMHRRGGDGEKSIVSWHSPASERRARESMRARSVTVCRADWNRFATATARRKSGAVNRQSRGQTRHGSRDDQ